MTMTEPMLRDLRHCVKVYRWTVGTPDYPKGRAVPIRTGRALYRRGLVTIGYAGGANTPAGCRPSPGWPSLKMTIGCTRGRCPMRTTTARPDIAALASPRGRR